MKGQATKPNETQRQGHRNDRVPKNWRTRLPRPADYYASRIDDLGAPDTDGWAQARCPIHPDEARSLSVDLRREKGAFRCPACGSGDLVSFEMRRTKVGFVAAVRALVATA